MDPNRTTPTDHSHSGRRLPFFSSNISSTYDRPLTKPRLVVFSSALLLVAVLMPRGGGGGGIGTVEGGE